MDWLAVGLSAWCLLSAAGGALVARAFMNAKRRRRAAAGATQTVQVG